MKKYLSYIMAALFASLVVFANCGGGGDDNSSGTTDGNSDQQTTADALVSGTLQLISVTKPSEATDLGWGTTTDNETFTISFTGGVSGGDYTTSNSRDNTVWPAEGTWSFVEGSSTQIVRNDGVTINLGISLPDITLGFTISTASATKAGGVIDGSWEFDMNIPQ